MRLSEENLFNKIVEMSEKDPKGIQPPFAEHGFPIHPQDPVDYESVRSEFYESILGCSDMVFHPSLGTPHIDIYRYPPTKERTFWCYVTNGMSDFPQLLPNEEPYRCELLFCTREDNREVPEYLRVLGEYPFDERTFLSANHTIPIPNHIIGSSHPFVMLIPPFLLEKAHSFDLNNNVVFTISGICITEEERNLAVRNSSEELINGLPDELDTWLLDGRIRR